MATAIGEEIDVKAEPTWKWSVSMYIRMLEGRGFSKAAKQNAREKLMEIADYLDKQREEERRELEAMEKGELMPAEELVPALHEQLLRAMD